MIPKIPAACLAAALVLMGCEEMRRPTEATNETLTSASATVTAVNQSTREVTMKDDSDGTIFTVVAGPEVRNLPQVAAGDHVTVDYYRAVTASVADPNDPGDVLTSAAAARAPEGARPGAAAVVSKSMVVQILSYDRDTGIARFQTPDGHVRTAAVPPDLPSFADTRGPGSRVLVTITEAAAVTITETAAN